MEAPDPLNAVEPAGSRRRSRSGPAVEDGDGVFQASTSGKYDCNRSNPVPDLLPSFSSVRGNAANVRSRSIDRNGRESTTDTIVASCDPAKSQLHFYYQNVRGLKTKITDVFLATSENSYDVFVFTETWLDDRIKSCQLFGDGFSVYRTDRSALNSTRTRGGGVLIAVSNKLEAALVQTSSGASMESIWVKISSETRSIFVGVSYVPPEKSADCECIQSHADIVSEINEMMGSNDGIIFFGDFNQPRIVWKSVNNVYAFADPLASNFSQACRILLDSLAFGGLRQRNMIRNHLDRTLDLIFSNDCMTDCSSVDEAPESVVDIDPHHPALVFTVYCSAIFPFVENVDEHDRDFSKVDYDALNSMLSQVDWSTVCRCSNVDDAVSCFNSILRDCFTFCVPLSRPRRKPAWSNSRLQYLRRIRSKMLKRFSARKNGITKLAFARASRNYRSYNRYLYGRYVRRVQDNLRRNPKQFWNFVNTKRNESGLPSTMRMEDQSASTAEAKCELFAARFASVFQASTASPSDVETATRSLPVDAFDIDIFDVNQTMVENALKKLKSSVSPGPDGIPACILKKCSGMLITPLQAIFNLSLRSQQFPIAWKMSYMQPIFKKGSKVDVSNYRGITSLPAGSKCFEIILNDVMFQACKTYISTSQHGFFPQRSVITNLCEYTSFCISEMEQGGQIDSIYTDIKAAFDSVNHDILLAKLERLGASSRICSWLRSYLTGRQLFVKIGSAVSAPFIPRCGVPQGSNLGPLLFALFFNDVSHVLLNCCLMFYADDLKIYLVVRSTNDCRQLQQQLDLFVSWCALNHLAVSVSKCCIISFRRTRNPILHDYTINGTVLNRVDHVKDLGVVLDYQLTFKMHYSEIVDKANRQLGFILKIANEFDDPLCLRSLYCSLVRSILEFASAVWSPYDAVWISRIESVQRKFVRCALRGLPWTDSLRLPPYEHRCALLGIEPLVDRRKFSQAILGAKILRSEIDCPALLSQLNIYAPQRVLRSRQLLRQPTRRTQYGSNNPIDSISRRLQDNYSLFDFNISTNVFRNRLRNRPE